MNEKKKSWYIKTISLAVIGLLFIAAYFFLVVRSPVVRLLRPAQDYSQQYVLEKAESFFNNLPLPTESRPVLKRNVSTFIDQKLFKYAQFYRQETSRFPKLAPGYWQVEWRSGAKSNDSRRQSAFFEFQMDFYGKLLRFQCNPGNLSLRSSSNLSEDDALMEATYFLESLDIDAKSLIILKKDVSFNKSKVTIYKFTLKNKIKPSPFLTETYDFEIVGSHITGFARELLYNYEALGWDARDKDRELASILQAIIWLTVILATIILFIKKLRRDELEFKWALWVGLGSGLMVSMITLLESEGNFMGVLFQASIVGALTMVGMLMLFSTAEAVSRESWPEKLKVIDQLFQGRAAVKEAGAGILNSYFLTGATVLTLTLLMLLTTTLGWGTLKLDSTTLGVFMDLSGATAVTLKNIVFPLMIGLLFFSFWASYLKRKLYRHPVLFVLLLAVSFDLAGMHQRFFEPSWLAGLLMFPIALLWALAVYRWDHFSVMLSFIGVNFLLELALLLLMPQALHSLQGTIVMVMPLIVLLLGIYLLFRPRSIDDYENYVPEYVSRIAEKERFLKELEIARGVQMRFLPQKVPQCAGLEIVSLCQPAMEVGGDYFDFIQVDDRFMTVLIGDVSGKGVSAAFYMTMVKGIIKTLSKKTPEPAKLLAEANEIFYENAPRDVFITIIYGVFDLKKKKLTLASAGHNPLIVRRHDTGKTEMVNPRGIAIGLKKGALYDQFIEEAVINFDARDVFVFYTDGVSEAMDMENEIFGEDRLRRVVERFGHLSSQQLQERIVNAVAQFSGKAPQHDDFTMVIVKIRPE